MKKTSHDPARFSDYIPKMPVESLIIVYHSHPITSHVPTLTALHSVTASRGCHISGTRMPQAAASGRHDILPLSKALVDRCLTRVRRP